MAEKAKLSEKASRKYKGFMMFCKKYLNPQGPEVQKNKPPVTDSDKIEPYEMEPEPEKIEPPLTFEEFKMFFEKFFNEEVLASSEKKETDFTFEDFQKCCKKYVLEEDTKESANSADSADSTDSEYSELSVTDEDHEKLKLSLRKLNHMDSLLTGRDMNKLEFKYDLNYIRLLVCKLLENYKKKKTMAITTTRDYYAEKMAYTKRELAAERYNTQTEFVQTEAEEEEEEPQCVVIKIKDNDKYISLRRTQTVGSPGNYVMLLGKNRLLGYFTEHQRLMEYKVKLEKMFSEVEIFRQQGKEEEDDGTANEKFLEKIRQGFHEIKHGKKYYLAIIEKDEKKYWKALGKFSSIELFQLTVLNERTLESTFIEAEV